MAAPIVSTPEIVHVQNKPTPKKSKLNCGCFKIVRKPKNKEVAATEAVAQPVLESLKEPAPAK